jgi:hypothetical protein
MRTVVLGGYGHFGATIAERLASSGSFDVVVAGRDAGKAARHAARIGAQGERIDTQDAALAKRLEGLGAQLVISAAGPFQGQEYGVAKAALAAGAHYIDIADARDYVCGIGALDAEARRRGRLVVSGASSVPALSSAAIDSLMREFRDVRKIEVGISASSRLPGPATLRSVLGRCGEPIRRWRHGEWELVRGWQGLRRHVFREPRMARWICDVEVPDLDLFPHRYPTARSVYFGAGVEPRTLQLGLWVLSALARVGVPMGLAHAGGLFAALAKAFVPSGSGRSGMFVHLSGQGRRGLHREGTWELTAQNEDGMKVPCTPAVALAKKLAAGKLAQRGAMPCMGLLDLEEILAETAGMQVRVHSYFKGA